ncbi:MAG TPA: hypothetical protein VMG12_08805, partial [Polyangiaceae bacterium]|nr:hypothetical protein [Polyangiaceae bacterium]
MLGAAPARGHGRGAARQAHALSREGSKLEDIEGSVRDAIIAGDHSALQLSLPFMRTHFILALALPLLAFSCGDDDSDTPAVGGTGGNGGSGTSGSGGSGGSAGSASGNGGSSGSTAGGGTGGSAQAGSSGAAGAAGAAGSGSDDGDEPDAGGNGGGGDAGAGDDQDDGTMTFFITSAGLGDGANLGGLEGADEFCTELAIAADADFGRRTWHAYLSTADVDARDRIGSGPWRNQAGEIIANDLTQLHDQGAGGALDDTWPPADTSVALDEQGNELPNNVHDILTGTNADGTADAANTCEDWTSNVSDAAIQARVGHSNRTGGGQPPSFSTTHTVG